jgi:hypothetical protein
MVLRHQTNGAFDPVLKFAQCDHSFPSRRAAPCATAQVWFHGIDCPWGALYDPALRDHCF